jgi:hypothetical protein
VNTSVYAWRPLSLRPTVLVEPAHSIWSTLAVLWRRVGVGRKQLPEIGRQCCSFSRRGRRRIARLCNPCRNAENGRQGKIGELFTNAPLAHTNRTDESLT